MINVIYLHGFASGPDSSKAKYFKNLLEHKNVNVIIPDLNEPDFSDLTLSRSLQQIDGIAESLNGDIHLMGSSLGGYMAALYSEQSHRVKSMILMAPAFEFPSRKVATLSETEVNNWKTEGYHEMMHYGYNKTVRLNYKFFQDAELYPDLPCKRNISTVIFHGVSDTVVDYHVSVNHLRQNSATKLILLNSDHSLSDQMDLMGLEVLDFLPID
jgi:uncharacterized protein